MKLRPFLRQRATGRRSGFTVIELLVATGISLVLLALLVSIVGNVSNAWLRTSGSMQTDNTGKLVLEILANDLQSAVWRMDGKTYLAATIQPTQTGTGSAGLADNSASINNAAKYPAGACKPSSAVSTVLTPSSGKIEDYRFGHIGMWLRFFTRPRDEGVAVADLSAVRAVAYQIARLPLGEDENVDRYVLFRSEVTNANTMAAGLDINDSAYTTGNATQGNAGNIRRPVRFQQLVGVNIIDFGLRVYAKNEAGDEQLIFPTDTLTDFQLTTAAAAAPLKTGQPSSIEVMLRVLTPEGADKIHAIEAKLDLPPDGTTYDAYWWEVALQHSRVLSKRIEYRSPSY